MDEEKIGFVLSKLVLCGSSPRSFKSEAETASSPTEVQTAVQYSLNGSVIQTGMTTTLNLIHLAQGYGVYVASALALFLTSSSSNMYKRPEDVVTAVSGFSTLKHFLKTDPSLYPSGKKTGYYGFLTTAQFHEGTVPFANVPSRSEKSGSVPVLNFQLGDGGGDGRMAPLITSVTMQEMNAGARINWHTEHPARVVVYYSMSPLTISEKTLVVEATSAVMTDSAYHTEQRIFLDKLQPNTQFHYLVYATDEHGNVSVMWPSTFQTLA